jgi:hypothetical protein
METLAGTLSINPWEVKQKNVSPVYFYLDPTRNPPRSILINRSNKEFMNSIS